MIANSVESFIIYKTCLLRNRVNNDVQYDMLTGNSPLPKHFQIHIAKMVLVVKKTRCSADQYNIQQNGVQNFCLELTVS